MGMEDTYFAILNLPTSGNNALTVFPCLLRGKTPEVLEEILLKEKKQNQNM